MQCLSKRNIIKTKEHRGVISIVKINRNHPAYLQHQPIADNIKKKYIEKAAAAAAAANSAAAAAGTAAGAAAGDEGVPKEIPPPPAAAAAPRSSPLGESICIFSVCYIAS